MIDMKKFICLFVCLSLLFAMCACGDTKTEDALVDFEVILDWYPNAVHSFLYLAKENGYFAEAGLDVTITPPANYSDAITFPASGKADVGIYYQADTTIAVAAEDIPITVIGAVTQDCLNVITTLVQNGIETPADLAGKTIGYSGGSGLEKKIRTLTQSAGLSDEDYTLIDVGYDLVTALTTGTVDAIAGGMINHEILQIEAAGYAVNCWEWSDFGVPRDYNLVFVAGREAYEKDSETYAAFLDACKKGFADMQEDPEAALAAIMSQEDAQNYPLDEVVERRSLEILIPYMQTEEEPFLSMCLERWQTSIEYMLQSGQIEASVDPSTFVTSNPQ